MLSGRVEAFFAIIVDAHDRTRRRSYFTRDWQPLAWSIHSDTLVTMPVARPARFDEILDIAERVGSGLDHARVDVYVCDDAVYVGEVTVYSHSGLAPFDPDAADFILGSHWRLRRPLLRAIKALVTGKREIMAI